MRSLYRPRHFEELSRRLDTLRPESPRRWGRMTAHQAVCHLRDSFRMVLGQRGRRPEPSDPRFDTWVNLTIGRVYALTLPLPWPKGVPTSPDADQEKRGSPPGDFDADVEALRRAMQDFRDRDGRDMVPHVAFRRLTRGEWGRWGYRHMDHHLRQFGA